MTLLGAYLYPCLAPVLEGFDPLINTERAELTAPLDVSGLPDPDPGGLLMLLVLLVDPEGLWTGAGPLVDPGGHPSGALLVILSTELTFIELDMLTCPGAGGRCSSKLL